MSESIYVRPGWIDTTFGRVFYLKNIFLMKHFSDYRDIISEKLFKEKINVHRRGI